MKFKEKVKKVAVAASKQVDIPILMYITAGLLTSIMGIPGAGWLATAAIPMYAAERYFEKKMNKSLTI